MLPYKHFLVFALTLGSIPLSAHERQLPQRQIETQGERSHHQGQTGYFVPERPLCQKPIVVSSRSSLCRETSSPCYSGSLSYCEGRYVYPVGYTPPQRVRYVVREPVYYYPVYPEREVIIIEKEKTPRPFSFFQLFISVFK